MTAAGQDSAAPGRSRLGAALESPPAAGPASAPVYWADEVSGREWLRRLECAQRALLEDPDHLAALRDELAALRGLERWPEAARTLARLVQLEPDNLDRRMEQVQWLLREQDWYAALRAVEPVLVRAAERVDAWYGAAVAHQALGHLAAARRSWDEVLARVPDDPSALAWRGRVLLELHEWALAARDLERALGQEPDNQHVVLDLSVALHEAGRPAEAVQCVESLLIRQPRCVPALNRRAELAWLAYRSGAADRAGQLATVIQACRRSLENDPQQPAVQDLLAQALAAQP